MASRKFLGVVLLYALFVACVRADAEADAEADADPEADPAVQDPLHSSKVTDYGIQ